MNLLFLAVCNVVLITFSFGIPRKRHSHVDSPEYNHLESQNIKQDHIPLEILENELLRSKNVKHPILNIAQQRKRKRKLNNRICHPASTSRSEEHFSTRVKDNCFSNKQPPSNQKPHFKYNIHKKKSFKRSFVSENNLIEGMTVSSQPKSSFEDFFGLFDTETTTDASITVVASLSTNDELRNVKPSVPISVKDNSKIELSSGSFISIENPPLLEDQFKQSFKFPYGTNKVARTIVLPGNKTNSNRFDLEKLDCPKDDLSSFFKQDEEGGEADRSLPLTSEEAQTENHFTLFSNSNESPSVVQPENPEVILTSEPVTNSPLIDLGLFPKDKTAMTSSSDKHDCEVQNKKKCICSFASLSSEIHSIFSKPTNPRNALEKFKQLHCTHYVPKGDTFEVSSHSKPKELDKQSKSIAVNEEKGPKEIDQSSLNEFITQTVSSEEDVKVPCFPTGGIHLLASDTDDVKYKWTHKHGKPISEGNIKENGDGEGTLFIEDINTSDSDNYTCKVDYINPDTGHLKKESFTHSVSVVSLPTLTVHVLVHYKAPQCGNSVTDIFRRYLPSMVERSICDIGDDKHLCSVEIHNAVCVDSSSSSSYEDVQPIERSERKAQPNQPEGPYWLRREKRDVGMKEISLNYEVCVHKRDERALTAANSSLCDANCHLVIGLKLLQLFRESMAEAVTTPVSLNMNNVSGIFYPVASTVKIKYVFGCLGGDYYKGQGFCMACPRHTFSELGAIVCTECPPHTYQGGVGASKCIPCTVAWMPTCNEYLEDTNKYIVVMVAVIVLMLLLIVVIWYFFGNRERREANVKKLVLAPKKKKNFVSDRKVKFGKSQKSIRRKLPAKTESAELQSFLDSSTDGETSATEASVGNQK